MVAVVTRRGFLKTLGALALSGVIGTTYRDAVKAFAQTEVSAPPLPWPYVELDVEYVRKMGHLGYYAFECAGGAFWAIMESLRQKIGYPYTLLPIPTREDVEAALDEGRHLHTLMQYGAGGALGWASLCGALNGAAAAIQMVSDNWKRIGDMLFRWYETTVFPSDKSNEYASRHEFFVKKYKSDKVLPQSVSHSILCHVSVSNWCEVSGYASGSPERSERCARLTGDVAAKAVELLNADLRGELELVGTFTYSQTTASCRTCHFKGTNYEMGQFTRGKMQCETCHTDMRPHAHSIVRLEVPGTSSSPEKTVAAGAALTGVIGAVAGLWSYMRSKPKGSK